MRLRQTTTSFQNQKPATTTTLHELKPDTKGVENPLVNLHPEVEYQEFMGFGGAFTEAAGYTLSQMPEDTRQAVIQDYFGVNGLGYSYCRTHLDSCDFSLGNYSAVTDPGDAELSSFSLARDEQYIIPMIKMAMAASPGKIKLLLSPWSPPAFMKTKGLKNLGKYTDKIEVTAFKTPAGGLTAVVLNRATDNIPYIIRVDDAIATLQAEPSSITTLSIG